MPRVIRLALFVVAASAVTAFRQPATGVTVFEGARVIVGDARAPIENASFIVTGARFVQVGRAADVRAPAAATHGRHRSPRTHHSSGERTRLEISIETIG